MSKVQIRYSSIFTILGLLTSWLVAVVPAQAITGISASVSGAQTYTVGTAITPITFTEAGAVGTTTYTVNNPLPAGLSLDSATGTISGTPTAAKTAATYTITASDAGNDPASTASTTVNIGVRMSILPDLQERSLVAGTPMTPTTAFTVSGGTGTIEYTLAGGASLPTGLSLAADTGVISGTPQIAQAATNYTITATDDNGFTRTSTVSIAISAFLTPATQTPTGVVGNAITPTSVITPTGLSGVITYTSNTLPAGLSLNASTGVISGTPTAAGTTNVTITGTDSNSRTATATLTFTISAATITPATQTLTATAGVAITPTTAFTTAGFTGAITYAVSPALPAGLTMSATGVISGTPTGNQTATVHTVTATGATSGTATATITITVSPRILPATQTLSASAGTAITSTTAFTPSGFTGTVVYSISPALPAGLTMSTTTGVISGTPTASQAATTHTITATGTTAGSTVGSGVATATITITVGASVTPATRAINLTQNVAMTPTTAYTLNGFTGTITYSITPALPAGLVMSTTTGIITGTPAVLVAPTNHTITVTGSTTGSATTVITLAIYAPLAAPTGVTATAGDTTATITWNAVTGATGYQVVSTPAGGVCAITGTQAVCSGLVNNTSYTFRVTAVNQVGPAALSTLSAAVTPKPPFITKTGKITIFYSVSGSVVPPADLIKLRALGTQFKKDKGTAAVISIKGFTTKAPTAIEKRLAASRATLVRQALRAAGLTGTYTVVGDATTNRVGVKARKVVVKYTYQAPN